MRYWAYLALKVLVALCVMVGLQSAIVAFYPMPTQGLDADLSPFLHDLPFTFLVLGTWFVASGMLVAIVWDQRRRCRTCCRKLIMPVASGSWAYVVLGRPRTASICPYGHGTLTIEELQITGTQLPDWHRNDDNIWKELESFYQTPK